MDKFVHNNEIRLKINNKMKTKQTKKNSFGNLNHASKQLMSKEKL